jgi:hypothetical protein
MRKTTTTRYDVAGRNNGVILHISERGVGFRADVTGGAGTRRGVASAHYSWGVVTKLWRRRARRARGAPRDRGVLEAVRRGQEGRARPPACGLWACWLVAAAYPQLQ